MKRYFWISIILCAAAYLQSCEKETMVYGGEEGGVSGIYFLYSKTYTMSGNVRVYHYQDSMEMSFESVPGDQTSAVLRLPVKVLGEVKDYDRTYKAKVTGGTAVEGVDYEPLQAEYVLPANAASTTLPLVLLRTEKLKQGKVNMIVELAENENFKLLLPEKLSSDEKTVVNTTRLKVIFSEIYTEPIMYTWDGVGIFGPFTLKKFEFINAVMGWSPADWDLNSGVVTAGILYYAGRKVQQELQLRADASDPVLDEDGSFMQLVGKYEVDYSKYE